jgi:phospholipid/cholesterol/gamma-HCH transport system substrate-binding protein
MRFTIGPEAVTITLEIEGEYRIPKDSRVELRSFGIVGGMVANVVPGKSPEFVRGGDSLPGGTAPDTFAQVDALAGKASQAVERFQLLLDQPTIENVHGSTADLRKLMAELSATAAEQRADLRRITVSLRNSAEGLEKTTASPELERAVKRLDAISEKLDGVMVSFDKSGKSLEAIAARVERGEGSLGKLTKDDELYDNMSAAAARLKDAAAEIQKLTEDIRRQPKRYLKLSVF